MTTFKAIETETFPIDFFSFWNCHFWIPLKTPEKPSLNSFNVGFSNRKASSDTIKFIIVGKKKSSNKKKKELKNDTNSTSTCHFTKLNYNFCSVAARPRRRRPKKTKKGCFSPLRLIFIFSRCHLAAGFRKEGFAGNVDGTPWRARGLRGVEGFLFNYFLGDDFLLLLPAAGNRNQMPEMDCNQSGKNLADWLSWDSDGTAGQRLEFAGRGERNEIQLRRICREFLCGCPFVRERNQIVGN